MILMGAFPLQHFGRWQLSRFSFFNMCEVLT
jgi:hypothetical protein